MITNKSGSEPEIFSKNSNSLMLLGNTRGGREIWLDKDDMSKHLLVTGSTGSGKSELLLALCANSIVAGEGLFMIDGKGDPNSFSRLHALAKACGRQDDVLLINFSHKTYWDNTGDGLRTNTFNFLLDLSADTAVQILVDLMDKVGGDGAMWKGRAVAMLTGVVRALVWLRSNGYIDLNVGFVREHMSLRKVIELSDESKYPDLPAHIRNTIKSYLSSLPGYQEEKLAKQAQTTLDQHGYLEMQFTKILGSLADIYGHIFSTQSSNIDMKDIIQNKRIVLVVLPSLGKSEDEVANLGRIVVSILKNTMAIRLGNMLEASFDNTKEVQGSAFPFLIILDEVSNYITSGMGAMASQARSLGFSMVFATQDIKQMQIASEKETYAILSNTNTKIIMKSLLPQNLIQAQILPDDKRMGAGEILLEQECLILKPGEFIISRDNNFLSGKALYTGEVVNDQPVSINQFVRQSPSIPCILADYRVQEEQAGLIESWLKSPEKLFDYPEIGVGAVYREPSVNIKQSINRAFTSIGYLHEFGKTKPLDSVKTLDLMEMADGDKI